jgi:phosphatidylglycerophosphate synthase
LAFKIHKRGQEMKKHIPNMVSLIRAFLAFPIAILPFHGKWGMAFVLLVLAALTDALDGFLARKLGVESKLGELVIDPISDFLMCAGAIAGLWLSGTIGLATIILLALFSLIFQTLYIIANQRNWAKPLKVNWLAFYYLGVLFWIFQAYAQKAMGKNYFIFLVLVSVTFMILAALKKQRIWAWIEGGL